MLQPIEVMLEGSKEPKLLILLICNLQQSFKVGKEKFSVKRRPESLMQQR